MLNLLSIENNLKYSVYQATWHNVNMFSQVLLNP